MSGDIKVPKRRFKEFQGTEGWKNFKLECMAAFSKGRGYSKNDLLKEGTPIILYGRLYTKYETRITEIDTFVKAKADSIYSKGGEVVVPASGETAEDIARAASVEKSGVLLGGDLNVITPNLCIDSAFLALSLSNGNPQKKLAKKAQGKSVVHIHNEDIKELFIPFPNKNEQEKISNYFSYIDNLITLNQRKLEKLKALKKAYLTQMFPAKGESKPKLRFAGFNDEWEKRKLGDITNSFSGGTPSVGNKAYYDGKIPFIRSGEINRNITELFISKDGLNNSSAKLVKKGYILYALYGATSGEVAISKISGAINQAILAIEPLKGYNASLLMYWLRKEKTNIINTYLQGGQGNLSGNIVKELLISIPKKKIEQEKVGKFLSKLDNLITLHQRKLEKLQNLKKAYLNEMFI